jgi:ElaB/YqjD/DUF883 family membrane-anchored ribosome-binding protein
MNQFTTPTVERTIDKLADTAASVPLAVERAAERATETARVGTQKLQQGLQQGTQQVKAQFNQVTDSAIAYVKDEPVRAMLIAAAAGAALMALANLLASTRR